MITFAQACSDPALFGDWFSGPSWATWRVIDKALFAEPLSDDELAVFQELTGRASPPTEQADEVWLAFGRRSGKDVKAAALCTYMGTLGVERYGWRQHLVPGERAVIQLLAVDKSQAQVCFGYTTAFFEKPLLKQMVTKITADTIELNNRISIEIAPNDERRVRGRTVCMAVLDEVAHWRSETSSSPDKDVYAAVKAAQATIPRALSVAISSVRARRGLFFEKITRHLGKDGPILAAKAPSIRMNPTIPQAFLDAEYERDPAWAAAEFGSEWRSDLEVFVPREVVEDCVEAGVRERPPERKHTYVAFADPSGGSSDGYSLCIAHREGDVAVVDVVRDRRPPFNPESVTDEYAKLLRSYRIVRVESDRFGGQWVSEAFRRHGINHEHSEHSKSELFLDLLPRLNAGTVSLVDDAKLVSQLCGLERKVTRAGRDVVDHPPGSHDDAANAVAGAVARAMRRIVTPLNRRPIQHLGVAQYDPIRQRYRGFRAHA